MAIQLHRARILVAAAQTSQEEWRWCVHVCVSRGGGSRWGQAWTCQEPRYDMPERKDPNGIHAINAWHDIAASPLSPVRSTCALPTL
jgi:hypothetical protein